MFDPVTAGVSGGAALISAILDAQAKSAGIVQAQQGLDFQKRNADRQYRTSTATRTDAYGNSQHFDETLNKWVTELAPMQERIIKAGEREQLLGLTDDAAQNRLIRQRAGQRGEEAGQDYARTRAQFNYGGPKSEGSIRDELTSLLVGSTQNASRNDSGSLNTQALRSGGGGMNPRRSSEALGGSLADIMLKAREGARSESVGRNQAHSSQYLPILQSLQQTMSGGSGAPINYSSTPKDMTAQQDDMSKLILAALQGGGQQVAGANKNLAELMFKSGPDTAGMARLMTAISGMDPAIKGSASSKNAKVPLGSSLASDDDRF